jgi:hypothetical protein
MNKMNKEYWENLKVFEKPEDIPGIPVYRGEEEERFFRDTVVPNLIRCGAIPKSMLKEGCWYIGDNRNTDCAKWNGKEFEYKRYKFNSTFTDTCCHFEDDDGYAFFIPFKEIAPKRLYTDREQSDTLEKAGLKGETSDLVYPEKTDGGHYDIPSMREGMEGRNDIPCWSAGALLEIIPEKIKAVNVKHDYEWEFSFDKLKDKYVVSYTNPVLDFYEETPVYEAYGDLMEVLVKTVKYLLENKRI